jgi:hypothetical protein
VGVEAPNKPATGLALVVDAEVAPNRPIFGLVSVGVETPNIAEDDVDSVGRDVPKRPPATGGVPKRPPNDADDADVAAVGAAADVSAGMNDPDRAPAVADADGGGGS